MFNFNVAEVFSNMEVPLLEKAKVLERISDPKELDKPINNYVFGLEKTNVAPGEGFDIGVILEDGEDDDLIAEAEAYENRASG